MERFYILTNWSDAVLSIKSWGVLENTFSTYALNLSAGVFLTHRIDKVYLEIL